MSEAVIFTEERIRSIFLRSRYGIFRGGLFVFALLFSLVAYFIRPDSGTVILRYNAFFGVDLLGVWWQAYLVPGICLGFFLGNLMLSRLLFRRNALLAALILLYGALFVVVSGALATVTLLFINT
ncbi:MAG: hypothetical protein ACEQSB_04725 [Undibacterium sp.]